MKQDADAFGSTLAQEEADPESEWVAWAERSSRADREITFVAVDGVRFLGMTMGFRPKDEPNVALLLAMWVDPSVRRQGIGAGLVEAVADWARAGGARRLRARVTEDSGPAVSLYGRTGFFPTSRREQLRPGSDRMTLTMERALAR